MASVVAVWAFLVCLLFSESVSGQGPYPVPLPPGGRNAVHGWLILPVDQDVPSDPSTPVDAYFVHHTPEFWTDSPHNFQLILYGTMLPIDTTNNLTETIPLPYPPSTQLLVNEFTITPPGPFSLNDLLTSRITTLYGVVYNGSFDTSYERYAIAMATLQIRQIVTSVYLNISDAIVPLPNLQYYSYPRFSSTSNSGLLDYYLSHKIHAAPDFDHVIHTQVVAESCSCEGTGCSGIEVDDVLIKPGFVWVFPNTTNDVTHRLFAGLTLLPTLQQSDFGITCKMVVLEDIHCVVGPAFADVC